MQAEIYINRHIIASNKKATMETGKLTDLPAIAIRTYMGTVYAKTIRFTDGCTMTQDAEKPRCKGATIWCKAKFESLIIDGVMADRAWLRSE